VAGHSIGELAAAHVAGVWSLPDACAVVAARSQLMQALPPGGAMIAVEAGEAAVRDVLERFAGVSVAAVNGPLAVVISGHRAAVTDAAAELAAAGARTRELRVSHAFHSGLMDPMLASFGAVTGSVTSQVPRIPLVSALTGTMAGAEVTDPGYWVRHVREPVRFADAVAAMRAAGVRTFIEIGPDAVLSALGWPTATDTGEAWLPALRRGRDEPRTLLRAAAAAYARGVPVRWASFFTGTGAHRVDLPTYPFQRQRYWLDGGTSQVPVAGTGGGEQAAGALSVTEARSVTEAWRYRVTWAPVPDPAPALLAGTWLALIPAGAAGTGLMPQVVQAMAVRGALVNTIEVAPDAGRAELAVRIGQALERSPAAISAVVSLLALAEAPSASCVVLPEGLAGTLALVQALGDAAIGAPLWVVTRGAVTAGPGEQASPAQAMTWGLGRVAALEHPDRWGGLIDLPPVLDEQAAARLCALLAGCGEDQAAIRPAGILGRRLARAPLPSGGNRWAPSGSVLITGGTGAIGGHVARWLSARGAPRVVLASRAGPAANDVAVLAARLAGAGTAVAVTVADVTRRADLAGLLAWAAVIGPGICAVMHAAGVVHETAIQDLTDAELAAVLAAKVGGAVLLDELTTGLGLEAFVLFSSISATWGSGQQSGYAAANAFLDALAARRQARGRPAASVAWGPWAEGGMVDRDHGIQLGRRGLALLEPDLAVRALGQVLDHRDGLVTIADVDWVRFAAAFTLRRPSPLLNVLPDVWPAPAVTPAEPGGDAATRWRDKLAGLSPAEQNQMLADLIRTEAALVLGYSSAAEVDRERTFRDLGFDSLSAIELRDRLTAATGLRLPATLVFDYPAPLTLADFLRTQAISRETDGLPVTAELDRLEAILCSADRDDGERAQIAARLNVIARRLHIDTAGDLDMAGALDLATDDQMFELVEKELSGAEFD
jgi:acyl transferase domain-containing protein